MMPLMNNVSRQHKCFTYMSRMEFFEANKTVTDSPYTHNGCMAEKASFQFRSFVCYSITLSKNLHRVR